MRVRIPIRDEKRKMRNLIKLHIDKCDAVEYCYNVI